MKSNGHENSSPSVTTTADLRGLLLEVIAQVRSGNLEANDANAIAKLAGRILESARLDVEVSERGPGMVSSVPLVSFIPAKPVEGSPKRRIPFVDPHPNPQRIDD